jgi:hypothetical protein
MVVTAQEAQEVVQEAKVVVTKEEVAEAVVFCPALAVLDIQII